MTVTQILVAISPRKKLHQDALQGDAGELLRLKRENEELSRKVKLRETEVSEKEDALRRLTSPPETPATPAAPERDEETPWTFFG